MSQIRTTVFAADPHISTTWAVTLDTQNYTLTLKIGTPPVMNLPDTANLAYRFPAGSVPRVVVGSRVQEFKLASKVAPANPTGATGTVSIWVVIGTGGDVTQVHVQDGPAGLQQAAIDAVQQCKYSPTLLNDKPCEVEALVKVPFGQ